MPTQYLCTLNGDLFPVSSADDLENVLQQAQQQDEADIHLIEIIGQLRGWDALMAKLVKELPYHQGRALSVFTEGQQAYLLFDDHGDQNYHSDNPDFLYGDEPQEIVSADDDPWPHWWVTRDQAWSALRQWYQHNERPSIIEWELDERQSH